MSGDVVFNATEARGLQIATLVVGDFTKEPTIQITPRFRGKFLAQHNVNISQVLSTVLTREANKESALASRVKEIERNTLNIRQRMRVLSTTIYVFQFEYTSGALEVVLCYENMETWQDYCFARATRDKTESGGINLKYHKNEEHIGLPPVAMRPMLFGVLNYLPGKNWRKRIVTYSESDFAWRNQTTGLGPGGMYLYHASPLFDWSLCLRTAWEDISYSLHIEMGSEKLLVNRPLLPSLPTKVDYRGQKEILTALLG
ncbi:hypothetical protein C4561_01145 [candidate division WWE3 bacterium]|jgi:hypothetical protein|uniref:Uncharacterized protein n=1 Tax=candidate division WWE3 bacterium TaxID=2053526 RepID=A0A3A4ZFB5_UNCKA|nr:MAG: hypothetical protein C4561_01145 [candidate division WWE3 bacterium]